MKPLGVIAGVLSGVITSTISVLIFKAAMLSTYVLCKPSSIEVRGCKRKVVTLEKMEYIGELNSCVTIHTFDSMRCTYLPMWVAVSDPIVEYYRIVLQLKKKLSIEEFKKVKRVVWQVQSQQVKRESGATLSRERERV